MATIDSSSVTRETALHLEEVASLMRTVVELSLDVQQKDDKTGRSIECIARRAGSLVDAAIDEVGGIQVVGDLNDWHAFPQINADREPPLADAAG